MGIGAFKVADGGLGVAEGDAAAETGVGIAYAGYYAAFAAAGASQFGDGFSRIFGSHNNTPAPVSASTSDPGMQVNNNSPDKAHVGTIDQSGAGPGAADTSNPQLEKVRDQIGDPKKFDPQSIRGMSGGDIESAIPPDWERISSKSGDGMVYRDPKNPGRQIRVMPGYSAGNRPDTLTHAPYAVVSQNGGKPVKVPLEGNPTPGGN
jgi:hypothetical protein